MFDRCRNAERPERQPTGLTTMPRCQMIVSRMARVGLRPHSAVFGGRRSVRSALWPRPTARANVDTAHVLFHLTVLLPPTGRVWPHWPAFFITGQNGRTGLATDRATDRPLSRAVLPRQLLALFIFA